MKRFASFVLAALLAVSLLVAPASALTLAEVQATHPAVLPAQGAPVTVTQKEKDALLDALYEASLSDIRDAIVLGLLTSQEVTAWYLDRIATFDAPYNCFITICDDALEQAARRDAALADTAEPGPLYGVPIVVKDNIHVAGYLTTNGRSKSSSAVSKENAAIVEHLLEAGAVILAKTNMSTDAQDARISRSAAVGETKNAYNIYLAAGGSSGGTSTSVSLNFAPAGLGTDTNSSLRIPAALAGCVALRVTTGLLDREGLMLLNTARDVPGAITRTVADQAMMLDILSGGGTGYRAELDASALDGARVGVLKQLTYAYYNGERRQENLDPEVQAAFAAAVEELRNCGAEVVEVSMSSIFSLSEATFPVGGYKKIPALTTAFESFLEKNDLDCVIFPTYLSTPQRSGRDEAGTYWNVYEQNFINNCRVLSPSAAVPEITVPIGYHSLGAGIGMQMAGRQYSEQLLLDLAYSYTLRYDHREHPVIDGETVKEEMPSVGETGGAGEDFSAENGGIFAENPQETVEFYEKSSRLGKLVSEYLMTLMPAVKTPYPILAEENAAAGETQALRLEAVRAAAVVEKFPESLTRFEKTGGIPVAISGGSVLTVLGVMAAVLALAGVTLLLLSRRRASRYRGRRARR